MLHLVVGFATFAMLSAATFELQGESATVSDNVARACSIYCWGPVLEAVQMSFIFNDSKTFVDMPMKYDPEQVMANFTLLPNHLNTTMQAFVDANFYGVGSDLDDWTPADYSTSPAFLNEIKNESYRIWASDINNLWLVLGKQTSPDVAENPQRHSFVPITNPMVIPGGRFRESYYWDSYWIIKGLLICNMTDTAWSVISNLIEDVGNFGFVPNGGRIYYLDRSQPPLLTLMIAEFLDAVGWNTDRGISVLQQVLPVLLTEHDWWMNPANNHVVTINATCGGIGTDDTYYADDYNIIGDDGTTPICAYTLNKYHSNATLPRPESYTEDIATCNVTTDSDKELCYRNIRSGAETGWDFSSRWFADKSPPYNMSSIDTTIIVEIELNAILYRSELTLAALIQHNASVARKSANAQTSSNANTDSNADIYVDDIIKYIDDYIIINPDTLALIEKYLMYAHRRFNAIQSLLWNAEGARWVDYNLTSMTQIHSAVVSSSSFDQQEGRRGLQGGQEDYGDDAGFTEATIASWIPIWAGVPIHMSVHNAYNKASVAARAAGAGAHSEVNMVSHFQQVLDHVRSHTSARWSAAAETSNYNLRASSNTPTTEGVSPTLAATLVTSLQNSGLIQVAGVLTTTLNTGQQWDAPNAWPPLVWLTIEGLELLNTDDSNALAEQIAVSWLKTGYIAYMNNGYMYEKYNAFEMGFGGGGGEYVPQVGFGWTNGVALSLLIRNYGFDADDDSGSSANNGLTDGQIVGITVGVIAAAICIGWLIIYIVRRRNEASAGVTVVHATTMNAQLVEQKR